MPTPLPPGPTESAWRQTARYVRDPVSAIERWGDEFGDLFTVRVIGMPPLVFAAAPKALRQIFTASPEQLETGSANGQLKPIVGSRSILILDGDEHHRHRRMMLPPFHAERMATYAATMRDRAVGDHAGARGRQTARPCAAWRDGFARRRNARHPIISLSQ